MGDRTLSHSGNDLKTGEIEICLPVKEFDESLYYTPHVRLQLDHEHARTFRRVLEGLRHQNARLNNGHGIDTPADVVRWIVESIQERDGVSVTTVPTRSKGRKARCDECGQDAIQRTPEGRRYCFGCEDWK